MKHYTHKITLEVFGFETTEEAQIFHDDFGNLEEMKDDLFAQFKDGSPYHDWSLTGWIENPDKKAAYEDEQKQGEILDLKNQLKDLVTSLKIEEVTGGDTADLINQITQKKADLDALTS